jgi:hypothetical protein
MIVFIDKDDKIMIQLLAMITFAYNLSPEIKKNLEKIEELKRKVLLTPLSIKKELRLRWEAQLERVFWSLSLSGDFGNKKQFIKLLSKNISTVINLNPQEKNIILYKNALDYIKDEWFVSEKSVTPKTIQLLSANFLKSKLAVSENNLRQFLQYLEGKTDHPIVVAAISQIQTIRAHLLSTGNGRLSRLLCLLFLYKNNYDLRHLITLEEYWSKYKEGYDSAVNKAIQTGDLTWWIEFFTQAMIFQINKTLANMERFSILEGLSGRFFEITDRQKDILNLFDQPDVQITNRKVQKIFQVSQITASRDLSKLANLGLLFTHGKGRSVCYTKAI